MTRLQLILGSCVLFLFSIALRAADIHVAAGQSIQNAIDAAPAGATIQIDAGVFDEQLTIAKPITLQGAGWDKTILKPTSKNKPHTDAEKIAFANRLEATTDQNKRMALVYEYLGRQDPPTVSINSAAGVTITSLKIQGIAPSVFPGSGSESLLSIDHSGVRVTDCALIGPSNDGIDIANDSHIDIQNSLVAAVWRTGVAIYVDRSGSTASTVHLSHCDIRNCYYAGVVIRGDGSTIDHCRISGAAWHGVRYDNCSPTITDNLIFGNARSGIYASGNTHATIRNNIFYNNEMDAISCWFGNRDTIERNTIVHNLREGISVLGSSQPFLIRNVVADNPVGITCSAIANEGDAVGAPKLEDNWFWRNDQAMQKAQKAEPAPAGSATQDPQIDNTVADYSLLPDSPARKAGVGADEIASSSDHWPIQKEETAMIPTSDSRDYNLWKKPPAIQ